MGATVGRNVPVLFASGTASSDPESLEFVRIGKVRDRSTSTEWDAIDATADTSPGLTKQTLVGYKQSDFGFSYVVTGEQSQLDFEEIAESNSPYCWLQYQFSGGYKTAWCLIKSIKLTYPSPDVVVAQVEAMAASAPVVIVPGVDAPTMDLLEPYRVGSTNVFKGVPWGPVTWIENSITYSQVVDVYKPASPTGAFLIRCHPAASPYDIADGSGLYNSLIAPALAAGITVFVLSCRHPKLSSTPTEFFDEDYGRGLQFIRSLHVALGFDPAKGYAYTQSRGSGMMIQALLPDLANPSASTYAGRMSSRGLKMIWAINPQAFNRSLTMATAYLTDSTQINLALADYPDDARQRDAGSMIATADLSAIPLFVAKYDATFQSGLVTYAAMQAAGGVLHYPNQGLTYRAAYAARGLSQRMVLTDQDDGSTNITADFVPTIQGLEAGLTLAQATTVARSSRLFHSVILLPQNLAGVNSAMDGSGVTPVVGGNIGGITDKSQGLNNTNTTGGAGQGTNSKKPKLAAIGSQYGAIFDSDDQLICQKANTGSPGFVAWTTSAMTTTLASQTTSQVVWSVGNGNTQTLAIVSATPLTKPDRLTYQALASEVAGADLFSVTT